MPRIAVVKYPTTSPADTEPLARVNQAGFSTAQILGVIGKTEGNGCVNDFSRTLSSHIWDTLIADTATTVFSGGTEGVLEPHLTFVLRSEQPTGLVGSVGRTRILQPWEMGTVHHADSVADTVRTMLEHESIAVDDVQLVLIKCPLLTSEKLAGIKTSGRKPATEDTYESMALSRYASAVGIGKALGQLQDIDLNEVLVTGDFHTAKASCSSGAELEDCHILILANDRSCQVDTSPILLRAFSTVMSSAIDFASLQAVLREAMTPSPPYKKARLVQVFAKAEADPSGLIDSRFRHTMLTDSDIHSTRHARAAVGGLIAGVTGDCRIYVSGGAEGQGPKGGGGVCVVVEWH